MRSGLQEALVPAVEAFGASRLEQRRLRRALVAAACERPALEASSERLAACWRAQPPEGMCGACLEHERLWRLLMAERKAGKALLRKIERVAIKAAQPEPEAPPEPKQLLALMEDPCPSETS